MDYDELTTTIIESSFLERVSPVERDYERQLRLTLDSPKPIKVITGIRRSGKSFLLKKLYKELVEERHIPKNNILFLNFENDRLANYGQVKDLRNIYDTFLTRIDQSQPLYLFLDEIQNIDGWQSFVRTIYDSTSYHIYITGSNSQLLSKKIASTLGGRTLDFHIFPFSFREFITSNKLKIPSNAFDWAEDQIKVQGLLDRYLQFGGLPEMVDMLDEQKIQYRSGLVEKIVVNDIIQRFKVRYPHLLRNIYRFLESNTGNITSVRRLTKWIQNLGEEKDVSAKTIQTYLDYLETAYLISPVRKFSLKTKEIFDTQKKYYFADNVFTALADKEDWLENAVYHHLIRKYNTRDVCYGRNDRGQEIDFIVRLHNAHLMGIQVCYQLTNDNYERETRILKAFKQLHQDIVDSLEVVFVNKDIVNIDHDNEIKFAPASRKLLDF